MEARSVNTEMVDMVLNVLVERMKKSNIAVEERMFSNIRISVIPYLENLKKLKLNEAQKMYVELIESNLAKISSPLVNNLRQYDLTPMEIQVANLIKEGLTTKDIANVMHRSKMAIDNHRYNLRKKLGINKKKMNLRSYLLSLS